MSCSATVSGTRPWPYQVGVAFVMAGGRVGAFEGECDCPVELDCKHAVAALLHHLAGTGRPNGGARVLSVLDPAVDAGVESAPAWELSLTQLLGASGKPRAERDRVHTALALQVSVVLHRPSGPIGAPFGAPTGAPFGAPFGTAGLRIRPIQYNARNRWVSTGVSWRDLRYGYYTAQYRPEQLEALRGVADLELRRNPQQALTAWIALDGPGGSQLWDALAEAQQSGVDLLLDGSHTPVDLSADPAEVALDLVRGDTLRLTPIIRLGERTLDPAATQLVGQPAHGLILGMAADRSPTPPIGLARLRRPLTTDLAGMLEVGTIPIPAADETRFLAEYLPGLRRRITVLCSDGSVPLPEPTPPRAALTVTREPGHRISLHWQWQEETGRRRDLDDRRGVSASDRAAIRRAIAAVLAAGVLPADTVGVGADGPEPLPRYLLEGADTVRFMTQAWPVLSGLPDLITELDGADSDLRYRPATSPPQLDVEGDLDDEGDDGWLTRDWFGLAVRVTVDGEDVPFESIFRALAGTSRCSSCPAAPTWMWPTWRAGGTGCGNSSTSPGRWTTPNPTSCGSVATRRLAGRTWRNPACSDPGPPGGGTGFGSWPWAPATGSPRNRCRPGCGPSCAATSARAWTGCGSGSIKDSVGSWPTTWAWARRCRCSA